MTTYRNGHPHITNDTLVLTCDIVRIGSVLEEREKISGVLMQLPYVASYSIRIIGRTLRIALSCTPGNAQAILEELTEWSPTPQ